MLGFRPVSPSTAPLVFNAIDSELYPSLGVILRVERHTVQQWSFYSAGCPLYRL